MAPLAPSSGGELGEPAQRPRPGAWQEVAHRQPSRRGPARAPSTPTSVFRQGPPLRDVQTNPPSCLASRWAGRDRCGGATWRSGLQVVQHQRRGVGVRHDHLRHALARRAERGGGPATARPHPGSRPAADPSTRGAGRGRPAAPRPSGRGKAAASPARTIAAAQSSPRAASRSPRSAEDRRRAGPSRRCRARRPRPGTSTRGVRSRGGSRRW